MKTRVSFFQAASEAQRDKSAKRSYPELWIRDGAELGAFLAMADLARC